MKCILPVAGKQFEYVYLVQTRKCEYFQLESSRHEGERQKKDCETIRCGCYRNNAFFSFLVLCSRNFLVLYEEDHKQEHEDSTGCMFNGSKMNPGI